MTSLLFGKVPVEKESSLSMGGAIDLVGIHSTVEKRAKRMPDITVETTIWFLVAPTNKTELKLSNMEELPKKYLNPLGAFVVWNHCALTWV